MKKIILFASDLIIFYAALILTLFLRYGQGDLSHQFSIHAIPFGTLFILWILAFYIVNLYEVRVLQNNITFYSDILRASLLAGAFAVLFFYLIPIYAITPRANLFIFIAVFFILETASRSALNSVFSQSFIKPMIIVGVNPQAIELAKFLKNNPQLGYNFLYIIDIDNTDKNSLKNAEGLNIRHGIKDMRQEIIKDRIDTIVVSPEIYKIPELINVFYRLLDSGTVFQNLASFYEKTTGRVPLEAIDQIWFLENLTEGTKRIYGTAKRFLDIVLATIAGVPFLVLLPLIALAIKMDSKGSVFYRQKRFGRAGKIFSIIKLRTMRKDAEQGTGAVWAKDNDPRVTRLGKFLRKSRVDELPQLWNILMGNMSFVGPRAERPEFHETIKRGVPFYEERYLIKPGLSGWAQINYRYGSSVKDAAEKLQYDLYYIKNRSLILDLGIILKTINISMRQAGR
jgi:exopolysaccharide biosynthesis polyprenyl glycosylphosphotransferase